MTRLFAPTSIALLSIAPMALTFSLVPAVARAEDPPPPAAAPGGAAAGDAAPGDPALREPTEEEQWAMFKAAYQFQDGPMTGDLGNADVKVPAGYAFTGKAGAQQFQLDNSGRANERTVGMLTAAKAKWILMFEYDDTGHIKDDDKDDIDADALLDSYKEGAIEGNKARQAAGIPDIFVDGWEQAPAYNDQAKVLEWAIKGHSVEDPRIVNFNTRLLGRTGVMSAVLLFGGDVQFKDIEPEFRTVLGGFAYKAGSTYGEYKSGDKLAEYGLAALVAGGGVAVAAKTGLLSKLGILLAKMGKLIIVGIIAVGAAISKLFSAIFGRKKDAQDIQPRTYDGPPPSGP
jgi:uncharacterized membrane-anchored protein